MDQKTVKPARKEGYCARDLTVRAFLFGNTPRAGQESSFTEVSGAPRPDRSRRPRPPRPPYYPLLVPPLTVPWHPLARPCPPPYTHRSPGRQPRQSLLVAENGKTGQNPRCFQGTNDREWPEMTEMCTFGPGWSFHSLVYRGFGPFVESYAVRHGNGPEGPFPLGLQAIIPRFGRKVTNSVIFGHLRPIVPWI